MGASGPGHSDCYCVIREVAASEETKKRGSAPGTPEEGGIALAARQKCLECRSVIIGLFYTIAKRPRRFLPGHTDDSLSFF